MSPSNWSRSTTCSRTASAISWSRVSSEAASAFVEQCESDFDPRFGELTDAAGEGLRDAVQLALHGGGECGQPFVVHDEGLDVGLGERGVFGVELGFQFFLRGYANGVAASGTMVFVAGQIGWNEQSHFDSDDLLAQARQALLNVRAVLAEAGARPEHIVRMTWYVIDKRDYLARGHRPGLLGGRRVVDRRPRGRSLW